MTAIKHALALAADLDAIRETEATEDMLYRLREIDGSDGNADTFVENLNRHFEWVADRLIDDNPRMIVAATWEQPSEYADGAEVAIEAAQHEAATTWLRETTAIMAAIPAAQRRAA